ncbi:MAG: beta-glucuronidase, partial [Anaerolineae bacterium]|nr:beta-glucuronidase [Anaerolineae bacterium]
MTESLIPRPEYPRPQFVRDRWVNLNGPWTMAFDFGKSGTDKDYASCAGFENEILVPFCPESKLSGVGYTDFIEDMWYQRVLEIPEDWNGSRIHLNFGGVDYACEIFIDGVSMGRHWGGTVAFTIDISAAVIPGHQHNLVVHVQDEVRSGRQPGGKQCPDLKSRGCHYTRTTGIWQTVWMEAVPVQGIANVCVIPDVDGQRFIVTPTYSSINSGQRLRVSLLDRGTLLGTAEAAAANGVPVIVHVVDPRLWSPEHPFLYDLNFEVLDENGSVIDRVSSYA